MFACRKSRYSDAKKDFRGLIDFFSFQFDVTSVYSSGFQLQAILSSRGHWAMYRDIFDCTYWKWELSLQASSGYRPRMLLNILQRTAWMDSHDSYSSEISIVLRLRNPDPYESIINLTLKCLQNALADSNVSSLLIATVEQSILMT